MAGRSFWPVVKSCEECLHVEVAKEEIKQNSDLIKYEEKRGNECYTRTAASTVERFKE
jgi:hypothetical protein